MKIELFYDKECPFCNSYANYISLKEKYELLLKNARANKEELDKLKAKGLDINEGFILRVDESKLLQGSEAIVFLNKLSEKRVYFLDNFFFKSIVYPLVKLFRKMVLLLMGRKTKL